MFAQTQARHKHEDCGNNTSRFGWRLELELSVLTSDKRESYGNLYRSGTNRERKKKDKKDEPMEAYEDVSLHDRRITVSRKLLERLCMTSQLWPGGSEMVW